MGVKSRGCFTSLAVQISSLTLGLATILLYLGAGRRSLLLAAADLWSRTILGRLLPSVSAGLYTAALQVDQFSQALPLGPWVSGMLLVASILLLRSLTVGMFGIRNRSVTYSDVFDQLLLFLPLALVWVWIFSGVMSLAGVFLFLAGYLAGIVGSVVLMSELTS